MRLVKYLLVFAVTQIGVCQLHGQEISSILKALEERHDAVEDLREVNFNDYVKMISDAQKISPDPSIGETPNALDVMYDAAKDDLPGLLYVAFGSEDAKRTRLLLWDLETFAIWGAGAGIMFNSLSDNLNKTSPYDSSAPGPEPYRHDVKLIDQTLPLYAGSSHCWTCFEYRQFLERKRAVAYPTAEDITKDPLAVERWLRDSKVWLVGEIAKNNITYEKEEFEGWVHLGKNPSKESIKTLSREQFRDLMNQVSYTLDDLKGEYINVITADPAIEKTEKVVKFERFDELSMPSFGGRVRVASLPIVAYQISRLKTLPYQLFSRYATSYIEYLSLDATSAVSLTLTLTPTELAETIEAFGPLGDPTVGLQFSHGFANSIIGIWSRTSGGEPYFDGGSTSGFDTVPGYLEHNILLKTAYFNWNLKGSQPISKRKGQILVYNKLETVGAPGPVDTKGWELVDATNHTQVPERSLAGFAETPKGTSFSSEFKPIWQLEFEDVGLEKWQDVSLPQAIASAGHWEMKVVGSYQFVMDLADAEDPRARASLVIRTLKDGSLNTRPYLLGSLEFIGVPEDFKLEYSPAAKSYTLVEATEVMKMLTSNPTEDEARAMLKRLRLPRISSITGKRLTIEIEEITPFERKLKLFRVKEGVKQSTAFNVLTIKKLEGELHWQVSETNGLGRIAQRSGNTYTYTSKRQPGYSKVITNLGYDTETKVQSLSMTEGGVTTTSKTTYHPLSSGPTDVLYPIVKVHRNDDENDTVLSPEESIETYTYHRWPRELEEGETPEAGSRKFFYTLKSMKSEVSDEKQTQSSQP